MLCFDEEVAREIGVNCAVVIHQINYWLKKGYGKRIEGRVYIYNTYEQWQKQLKFMSLMTIRRTFQKLIDNEIVFTYRKGYDRTSYWSLNYSHPICSKRTNPCVQSEQMDVFKVNTSVHTLTTKDNKQNIQPVGKTKPPTTSRPSIHTRSYRTDFKEANEWLEKQTSDFQFQVREYSDYHCNSPNTKYPHALRMKIIVEIWKKYNNQTNHTDFHYIDKAGLKPSNIEHLEVKERIDPAKGYEEEMEQLYLQGEI